jgi:hypothetical protein
MWCTLSDLSDTGVLQTDDGAGMTMTMRAAYNFESIDQWTQLLGVHRETERKKLLLFEFKYLFRLTRYELSSR